MESKLQTISQVRSKFALSEVLGYMKEKEKIDKETRNFVIGTPSVILQNGLGQALAFWASKVKSDSDNEHDRYRFILDAITAWLIEIEVFKANNNDQKNYKQLIIDISEKLSQKDYLIAQKEVIFFLEWMKRYANAFWEVDKD